MVDNKGRGRRGSSSSVNEVCFNIALKFVDRACDKSPPVLYQWRINFCKVIFGESDYFFFLYISSVKCESAEISARNSLFSREAPECMTVSSWTSSRSHWGQNCWCMNVIVLKLTTWSSVLRLRESLLCRSRFFLPRFTIVIGNCTRQFVYKRCAHTVCMSMFTNRKIPVRNPCI